VQMKSIFLRQVEICMFKAFSSVESEVSYVILWFKGIAIYKTYDF